MRSLALPFDISEHSRDTFPPRKSEILADEVNSLCVYRRNALIVFMGSARAAIEVLYLRGSIDLYRSAPSLYFCAKPI